MSARRPRYSGRLAGLGCAWLALGLPGPGRTAPNQPPAVTIVTPADGSAFEWDRLVRYSIRVSDPEDGETEYDEIPRGEVFLEVTWEASAASDAPRHDRRGPPGLDLMKESNCFNCHSVNTRVLGPPFAAIAARYAGAPAMRPELARRVRDGSVGAWGDMPMLPHPEFSAGQLEQMIGWVLERATHPGHAIYAGTEGVFRTRADPGPGSRGGTYRLTASYTDHGVAGKGKARRRGHHTIALRAPAPEEEASHEE